jgi:hypothetical protein
MEKRVFFTYLVPAKLAVGSLRRVLVIAMRESVYFLHSDFKLLFRAGLVEQRVQGYRECVFTRSGWN